MVNRVLAGAQAVLQLSGSTLWRRGGTAVINRVYQWSGRPGRRWPWGRGVGDFTPYLTTATSSDWTGHTRAPGSTDSKWGPKGETEWAQM